MYFRDTYFLLRPADLSRLSEMSLTRDIDGETARVIKLKPPEPHDLDLVQNERDVPAENRLRWVPWYPLIS